MILQRVKSLLEPAKSLSQRKTWYTAASAVLEKRSLSTESGEDKLVEGKSTKNISQAMKAYLERARVHDEFIKQQQEEFQLGKRHLANMMGEDPETFTQEDIDSAIEYLFPSGLYEKHARPFMKPPEEVFPVQKAAEFDETGRPYHFLFYTGKSNFYQTLHDTVENINELNKFEDHMIRKGLQPDPNLQLQLTGYQWLGKEMLEKNLMETLHEKEYNSFINAMERLSSMPYSYKVKDFILKYSWPLMNQVTTYEVPKPQYDTDGRAYVTVYECLRKTARGDVTIRSPGTGKVSINGQDITYFESFQTREQVSFVIALLCWGDIVFFSCTTGIWR